MKTFQLIPAFRNVEELQKIIDLICIAVNPVKIILLGRYAGMELCSALGGYELLVVVPTASHNSSLELQRYVDQHLPPEERREKHLFIYVLPFEKITGEHHTNYFFHQVNIDGYLLYDDKSYSLWRRPGFKSSIALRSVERTTKQGVELGNQFLQVAKEQWVLRHERMTAFLIYQAVRQFFRAVIGGYYGFELYEENSLISDYSLVRHVSEKLAGLWDLDNPKSKKALTRIYTFNYSARFARNFNIPQEKLSEYVETVQCLAEETERVCRERILLLENELEKETEGVKNKIHKQEKLKDVTKTDEKALPL